MKHWKSFKDISRLEIAIALIAVAVSMASVAWARVLIEHGRERAALDLFCTVIAAMVLSLAYVAAKLICRHGSGRCVNCGRVAVGGKHCLECGRASDNAKSKS